MAVRNVWRDVEILPEHIPPSVPVHPPHAWPVSPCQECRTVARFVEATGLNWRCDACGGLVYDTEPEPKRQPNVIQELENLARWTPDIDGSAIPLEAPDVVEETDRSGRTHLESIDGAEALEQRIDAMLSPFCHLSSKHGSTSEPGRPDHVDADSDAFTRAIDTLRKLDHLAFRVKGGREHVLVLLYVGWFLGSKARTYWDCVDEDALTYGEEDSQAYRQEIQVATGKLHHVEPLGLDWRVGMVFAAPETRAAWLMDRRAELGRGMARAAGKARLTEAIRAYQTVPDLMPSDAPVRLSLAKVRQAIAIALTGVVLGPNREPVYMGADTVFMQLVRERAIQARKDTRYKAKPNASLARIESLA
jgi:hypothetical protein